MLIVLSHKVKSVSSLKLTMQSRLTSSLVSLLAICGLLVKRYPLSQKLPHGIDYSTQATSHWLWLVRPLGNSPTHLRPLSCFLFSTDHPCGSSFVLYSYRHRVSSRPIAFSSPSWELLTSWSFGGHASLYIASYYGQIAVCATSLPFHKVSGCHVAYRLLNYVHSW